MTETYDFSNYMEHPDLVILHGYLKAQWMGRMPFMSAANIEKDVDDNVSIGLHDTYRLYASLYGQPAESTQERHVFDPKKHFLRTDPKKQPKGARFQLVNMQYDLDGDDISSEEQTTGLLHMRLIESGYKGTRVFRGSKKEGGKEKYVTIHDNSWWNNHVPVGTHLTHIRRFMSGHVMPRPGKDTAMVPVGIKDTLQTVRLTQHDALIVRGREGRFYSLPHPFYADPQITDEEMESIEMISLCRFGESYPLTDTDTYTDFDQEALSELTQRIIGEQVDMQISRLGKFAIRHSNTLIAGTPAVAAGIAAFANIGRNPWGNIALDLGAAALIILTTNKLRKRIESPGRYGSSLSSEVEGALFAAEEKYVQSMTESMIREQAAAEQAARDERPDVAETGTNTENKPES
jgi:hypothetical protein